MVSAKLLLPLQAAVITTKTIVTIKSNSYDNPSNHCLYTCFGYANNCFVIVASTVVVVVYNDIL